MHKSLLPMAFMAGLSACGTDLNPMAADSDTAAINSALATPPVESNALCVWKLSSTSQENIFFLGYGYTGEERGFRIKYGNYDADNGNLDYHIEVLWNPNDCSGTAYTIRFPLTGNMEKVEISVKSSTGQLMGRLTSSKGQLPSLYNQDEIELATGKLGPFVVTDDMVGGTNGMDQTITFALLDADVLARLPEPNRFNGAEPTNELQAFLMDAAYVVAIQQHATLFSLFTFRRALNGMSQAAQQRAVDAIQEHIYEAGPIHGDEFWEEHHHVDHGSAVVAPVEGESFGGFFNGHRNYLADMEADFANQGSEKRTPFRRLPAWDPALTIPAAFDVAIADTSGGTDLDSSVKAGRICKAFALEGRLFLSPPSFKGIEEELFEALDEWHGMIHIGVGGDMLSPSTAARAPIFHPWHTTVDTIWRNWQLCEAAWQPDDYDWEGL